MKGTLWITDMLMEWSDGHITLDNEMLTWDMFFKVYRNIKFRTYDLVVDFIDILTPPTCRHNFDLKPKCLIWRCSDYDNCPFVLEILPFGSTVGKTTEELKKGSYYIRKAQDHDHSLGTLVIPSYRNESVSKYHKLKKKLEDAKARMDELEDQLKRSPKRDIKKKIHDKIRNLRKLIKKVETDMEKITDVKDQLDDECAIDPNSKQTRQGKIRKEYALSHLYGYVQKCLKRWSDMYAQSKRLTQPVFPPDSSSSSTPISCELVGDNGCKWSKDVYKASSSYSQIS